MTDEYDEFYRRIGEELGSRMVDPGLMARAVAESGGDQGRATSLYIRYRLQGLLDEAAARSADIEEETRRRGEEERRKAKVDRLLRRAKAAEGLDRVKDRGLRSALVSFLWTQSFGAASKDDAAVLERLRSLSIESMYVAADRARQQAAHRRARDLFTLVVLLEPDSEYALAAQQQIRNLPPPGR